MGSRNSLILILQFPLFSHSVSYREWSRMLASVWTQIGKYVQQQHLWHDHGCSDPLPPPEPGPASKTAPDSIYIFACSAYVTFTGNVGGSVEYRAADGHAWHSFCMFDEMHAPGIVGIVPVWWAYTFSDLYDDYWIWWHVNMNVHHVHSRNL